VDAMGSMLTEDPSELGAGLPGELSEAFKAISGGMAGLGGMMRRIGGMMVGSQTGAAVGALAQEVVSSTDVGLPLGPEGTAALLPAGVAAFGAGLSVDPDQVRLFLALREAAHHRLFAHVPWLRGHLLSAVEDYARGITVDPSQLRAAMPQIDPANPEGMREALSGAALFQPEDTPQQKAALNRLETALALVEGRDSVWSHPDLLPTAEDFDDPDGFVAGKHEIDMSELEDPGAEGVPGEDGGSSE